MNFPFSMKKMYDETPYKIYDIANGDSLVGYGYEPLGGVVRIDDNDPRIVYSKGDWSRNANGYGTEGLNQGYMATTTIGATISFGFIGTAVYAPFWYAGNCGKIGISIDGGAETVLDLYVATSQQFQYKPIATGLTFGHHTITITTKERNPLGSNAYFVAVEFFDVITTTNSSIKLAKDGIQNKSSALTLGNLNESDVDITQSVDEITQLMKNASLKRMSPTWAEVFQDNFNRADGAAGNGWSGETIVSNKLSLSPTNISTNGSVTWSDRRIRFSFVAPSVGLIAYIKMFNGSNKIAVHFTPSNMTLEKSVGGVNTSGIDEKVVTLTPGTTYYATLEAKGNIYTASITSNPDYVTGITTSTLYESGIPTGYIGFYAPPNSGATLIDDVIVTAPTPYGWTEGYSDIGYCFSYINNVVKMDNRLNIVCTIKQSSYIPVVAGQSYTFKIKRKITSYNSGNGACIRIAWYQSDGTTSISTDASSWVTTVDSDYVEVSITAIAPAGAALANPYPRTEGILTSQWKEPLFELTSTATGVFHEKESRMDLVSLNTSGSVVITKGTGESEIGYRVEQDGVISKFYRDSATIPHWDRAKVWTGGTGWVNAKQNGSFLSTSTTNDAFYISFVGVGASINYSSTLYRGVMGITIDDGVEFFVDTYNPGVIYDYYLIKGLSYGQHQIKIRNTGLYSLGQNYIGIQSFDIYVPKIPATPANCQPLGAVLKTDLDDGWIRYEETEGVVYSGTWANSLSSVYSGNSHKYSQGVLNEYGEFSFIGTGIRWLDIKSTIYGIAEVFTDEGSGYVSRGTIDQYNSSALYQQVLFTRIGMPLQLNKVKINSTHTKNASASDYVNGIDAFEVKQPLYTIDLRKKISKGAVDYFNKLIASTIGDVNLSNIKGNTPGTIVDYINLLKAQVDLTPKCTTGNTAIYVNGSTGSDINDGSSGAPFKTIQQAVSKIPQILNHNATIYVAAGTYAGIGLSGFVGKGSISIIGANSLANAVNYNVGAIAINMCQCPIIIQGFNVTDAPTATYCASVSCSIGILLKWISMSNSGSTSHGVNFIDSYASMTGCSISNKYYAIGCYHSNVFSDANTGSNNVVGIYCGQGGTVGKSSTQPAGTTAEATDGGGVIR